MSIIESSIKGSLKFKGHGDGSVWEGDNHSNMVHEAKAKAERRCKIVYEPEENIGVLATNNSFYFFFAFYLAKKTATIVGRDTV